MESNFEKIEAFIVKTKSFLAVFNPSVILFDTNGKGQKFF